MDGEYLRRLVRYRKTHRYPRLLFWAMIIMDAQCPYLDKDCPKVENLEQELKEVKDTLKSVLRVLYALAGIVAIQTGISVI